MHIRTAKWKNVDKELTVQYFQRSLANNVAKIKVITEHKVTGSKITMTYQIYGNGLIDIQLQLKTGNKRLPELPRFGMKMTLPKDFNRLTWYGRGPHESYCCLLYTSPSPRDRQKSRMPSSA